MKICNTCGDLKPLAEFSDYKNSKSGKRCYCKACHCECVRKYRAANPEKARETERKYRAANLEKCREIDRKYRAANLDKSRERDRNLYSSNPDKAREYKRNLYAANPERLRERARKWRLGNLDRAKDNDRKYRAANPEKSLWSRAKSRANKAGREFTIEVSDVVIPEVCPYLNIPLTLGKGKPSPNSPSLDRKNSSKGYVPGNVEVISHLANSMKNSATWEQLVTFAEVVIAERDAISKQVEELNELARMYATA